MNGSLRFRLSTMMFLQYFVWGAWFVAIGTYLSIRPTEGGLNFPGGYIGLIYGTLAIGAMISPLLVGLFADRLFPTERILAVLHLAGAGLLGWAAYTCQQYAPGIGEAFNTAAEAVPFGAGNLLDGIAREKTLKEAAAGEETDLFEWLGLRNKQRPAGTAAGQSAEELKDLQKRLLPELEKVDNLPNVRAAVSRAYEPLFWIMLFYAVCYMPTLTLTNALSFRNLSDPDRYFGGIRVFGTIGWIVAGWVVSFVIKEVSAEPLYLAAGSSALLGLFCFSLPHTPPARESTGWKDALGLPALGMLKDRSFLVFFLCSFLITIPLTFYYAWTTRFLHDLQAPFPTAVQTIGQVSEIFFMLLIPIGLRSLKTKGILIAGMIAWCLRYAVFATEDRTLVIGIGLPLHGICYDFFFVVSYLYVDRRAPRHLRASAQGLITFITLGVGSFLGNYLAGETKEYFSVGNTIDYGRFWLVPLAIAGFATILFALLFRESSATQAGESIPTPNEEFESFEGPK